MLCIQICSSETTHFSLVCYPHQKGNIVGSNVLQQSFFCLCSFLIDYVTGHFRTFVSLNEDNIIRDQNMSISLWHLLYFILCIFTNITGLLNFNSL